MYGYRCTLQGHSADVRNVSTATHLKGDSFLSCSQDKTACVWKSTGKDDELKQTMRFVDGKTLLTCICITRPLLNEFPDGTVFTGGTDNHIRVYDPNTSTVLHTLAGHQNTVCSLSTHDEFVISGSWDRTARIWRVDQTTRNKPPYCIFTLSGHSTVVNSAVMLETRSSMLAITASADCSIKIWKENHCRITLPGHTDSVGGVVALPHMKQFLSCSNDCTINRWSTKGKCMFTYSGHSKGIYAVAGLPGGPNFVSSGKDRTVRVWSIYETSAVQVLFIPAQNCRSITVLSNSDILVGCSDATIRIFTRDNSKKANGLSLSAFQKEITRSRENNIASNDSSATKKTKGQKSDEIVTIKCGFAVEAYRWNAKKKKYVQTHSKTTRKEYDFIFEIQVEDNGAPYYLPYNKTEHPLIAAQHFVDEYKLNQNFLNQLGNMIFANSRIERTSLSEKTTKEEEQDKCDSYILEDNKPCSSSKESQTNSIEKRAAHKTSEPNHDQFDQPAPPSPARTLPANCFFPLKTYIYFENGDVSCMIKKIQENATKIHCTLRKESVNGLVRLTSRKETPCYDDFRLLWTLLHWPSDYIYPVFDLLRYHISSFLSNHYFFDEERIWKLIGIFQEHLLCENKLKDTNPKLFMVNTFLIIRCICNFFRIKNAGKVLLNMDFAFLRSFQPFIYNKNYQVSIATLILNFATLLSSQESVDLDNNDNFAVHLVKEIIEHLHYCDSLSAEAVFRLLVALGTLMHTSSSAVRCAESWDFALPVQMSLFYHGKIEKIKQCARFILLRVNES